MKRQIYNISCISNAKKHTFCLFASIYNFSLLNSIFVIHHHLKTPTRHGTPDDVLVVLVSEVVAA